ncbi:hypothetical protein BGZ49_000184 [Haplosporangium sp. Z 27]|nr:hypothetical protein BGZ49_000184 [Haplosporangium sp. Z 27]
MARVLQLVASYYLKMAISIPRADSRCFKLTDRKAYDIQRLFKDRTGGTDMPQGEKRAHLKERLLFTNPTSISLSPISHPTKKNSNNSNNKRASRNFKKHQETMRSFIYTAALAATALLFSSSVSEAAPLQRRGYGQTGALISETEYCIFLPPVRGGNIADNEDRAVAFCNVQIPSAPNAGILPHGLIQSVHFVENTAQGWVQITGRLNPSAYGLKKSDEGGQYDMRAPVGASFAGYKAFVQITEPDSGIYCLRACKNKSNCPVNKSEDGCVSVIGGDYS